MRLLTRYQQTYIMQNSSKLRLVMVLLSLGLVLPCAEAKKKDPAPTPITSVSALKAKIADLTDAQAAQAEKIFAAEAAAIKALGDTPDSAAVSKIQDDTKTKIEAILTPAQKAIFDAPVKAKKKKNSTSTPAPTP